MRCKSTAKPVGGQCASFLIAGVLQTITWHRNGGRTVSALASGEKRALGYHLTSKSGCGGPSHNGKPNQLWCVWPSVPRERRTARTAGQCKCGASFPSQDEAMPDHQGLIMIRPRIDDWQTPSAQQERHSCAGRRRSGSRRELPDRGVAGVGAAVSHATQAGENFGERRGTGYGSFCVAMRSSARRIRRRTASQRHVRHWISDRCRKAGERRQRDPNRTEALISAARKAIWDNVPPLSESGAEDASVPLRRIEDDFLAEYPLERAQGPYALSGHPSRRG